MGSMFSIKRQELSWGGRQLVFETGQLARQAEGAVLVRYGNTSVLGTVTVGAQPRSGQDFLPLTVNYQEKAFAAGKIPGGFFKREGRPGEAETLTSRLIDRPLRPLFHPRFRNDVQIVCTVLSYDLENEPDIVGMLAASAAVAIAGLPLSGIIGGARVGLVEDQFILNPRQDEMANGDLDLIIAGTQDGVLMVESQASELSESRMLDAVLFGHQAVKEVIAAIMALADDVGAPPWPQPEQEADEGLAAEVAQTYGDMITQAHQEADKKRRQAAIAAVYARLSADYAQESPARLAQARTACAGFEKKMMRQSILSSQQRLDGRAPDEIRPIETETQFLPMAHGSALFTRGETQALVATTLGTGQDEQIIDSLQGNFRRRFMLHYNFPPYSVGEAAPLRPPGRREIGHGKLAWRALEPVLPAHEDFPYTLRVVSEITESNGSSSMATVCGSSLALMDAGVPLRTAVAGIAMGLIKEGEDISILSDILGDEDHLGDMDFKVAGTQDGITALQMDIKITSITPDIMEKALEQARVGRLAILEIMAKDMEQPRAGVAEHAPRITTITVPQDKIRQIIGPSGRTIREITEATDTKIDINDDGTVKIAASEDRKATEAINWIKGLVAEPEVGAIYSGKVVKIVDFGAFVSIMGKRDGLVHISQLAPHRVQQVTDVVQEGDTVRVKCIGIDERGKIKLSIKAVDS